MTTRTATSVSVAPDDPDYTLFNGKEGRGRIHILCGEGMGELLDELSEAWVG